MRDVERYRETETPHECFECGIIIDAENQAESCPNCGGEMRNRRRPLE